MAGIALGNGANRVTGTGDTIVNQGGTDTLTDTGTNNMIVMGAGLGVVNAATLTNGDVFDLRSVLAATGWDQQAGDLGAYLSLGVQGGNTTVSAAARRSRSPPIAAMSAFVPHSLVS